MNLSSMLAKRDVDKKPVRIGVVGAGKFAGMFLAQAIRTRGFHVAAVADLALGRARQNLARIGWTPERSAAPSIGAAMASGATYLTEDALAMIADPAIEVVVEATGDPPVGIAHALTAISAGKHVVMVNVEADVVAGPLLARKAAAAGVVYSLAYGDQPALICELVDWARTAGFDVVAAGKGTRYHPTYHASTPETVWSILDQYLKIDDRASINPKMFNSFIDGSKSGIEMTAVCNATGLRPQPEGLGFPPATRFELADICKPRSEGGTLAFAGTTEVVSSVTRDLEPVPHDLALGVYVVIEGASEYVRRCFREYHMLPDRSGRYSALYRPTHLIGLELGISIASAACRREATGAPKAFLSDVVATAKRALKAGDMLDGEGGATVWGKQMPAERSLALGALPLGLAHKVRLKRDVAEGGTVRWDDVEIDRDAPAVRTRREMEAAFAPVAGGQAAAS